MSGVCLWCLAPAARTQGVDRSSPAAELVGLEDEEEPADPPENGLPAPELPGDPLMLPPPRPEDRAGDDAGALPKKDASPDTPDPGELDDPPVEDPALSEVRNWLERQPDTEEELSDELSFIDDRLADQSLEDTESWVIPRERFSSRVLTEEFLSFPVRAPLLRQGFRFSLGASVLYDSNLFLEESGEDSDLAALLSPTFEFRSAPEEVRGVVTARYMPLVRRYLDESSLDTIDHSAEIEARFRGAKGEIAATLDFGKFSVADRIVGTRVDRQSYGLVVDALYDISARSFLEAAWQAFSREDDGVGVSDSETYVLNATAFWRASPFLNVGPSIRHVETSSGALGDRSSWALSAVAAYTPDEAFTIQISAGVEQADGTASSGDSAGFTGAVDLSYQPNNRIILEGGLGYAAINQAVVTEFGQVGGGSQRLTGRLSCIYTPNNDWNLDGTVFVSTNPSPSASGVSVNDRTLQLAATRKLPRGSLTCRGTLTNTQFDSVFGAAPASRDSDGYRLAIDYVRVLSGQDVVLNSSLQWSGNSGVSDWKRLQG
ncbi:MAG: hypothetical protein HKO57_07755, partial [Akkermansiaceae bacterium]|nr:hypothetical protein [Akkermansiaceae bacterium]